MKLSILAASAILALTAGACNAADNNKSDTTNKTGTSTSSTTSPGASSYAPGQQMKNDTTGSTGASTSAPGQQMKNDTSTDLKNGDGTSGSATKK